MLLGLLHLFVLAGIELALLGHPPGNDRLAPVRLRGRRRRHGGGGGGGGGGSASGGAVPLGHRVYCTSTVLMLMLMFMLMLMLLLLLLLHVPAARFRMPGSFRLPWRFRIV